MINDFLAVYDHDQLLVDKFYSYRLQVVTEEWIWGLDVVCLNSLLVTSKEVPKASVSTLEDLALTELFSGEKLDL